MGTGATSSRSFDCDAPRSRRAPSLRMTPRPTSPLSFRQSERHGEDYTESGLPGNHLVVSIGGFFQGIAFDHRAHPAEGAELQRILRVPGGAGGPPANRLAPHDELDRRDGQRFKSGADDHQSAVRA